MECGMERRFHRGFTASEKKELWDRWKRESLKAIGRAFGKPSSSIYFLVQIGVDAVGARGDFQRHYDTSIDTIDCHGRSPW